MKNLVIFLFSFIVYFSGFAQYMEKDYYENNQDIGGDATIKSSSVKVENNEISKIFKIETSESGDYYLDAWMMAPFTTEGYREYLVAVNDVPTGFTFKPESDGWHSLALTDARKSVATVNLIRGINTISIIGTGPEIPNVEFIKLSSNLSRTGISDSKYRQFIESIESGTLNETYSDSQSSNRGTDVEIYDYCMDMPVNYTTYMSYSFSAGQNVLLQVSGVSSTVVMEFFSMSNPGSYSWSATSNGSINITIPLTGAYMLRLRPLNPNDSGLGFFSINGSTQKFIYTCSSQPLGTRSYTTPSNFFTCKIKNGGDTWLWLEDNTGKIRAFNDDGGTTYDGYSWGNASRITTNLSDIIYGHVSSYSSNNPVFECDLYMGLKSLHYSNNLFNIFPYLVEDNSFMSGPDTNNYNCVAWSVGDKIGNPFPSVSILKDWDDYYWLRYLTRYDANENNAAVALWWRFEYNNVTGKIDTIFTHASVRKHSMSSYPHGFEWESKCGSNIRLMHTMDALNSDTYGSIAYYYRHMYGTVDYSFQLPLTAQESSFSNSDLNQIAILKTKIPDLVITDFDEKYLLWQDTWKRPEISIHSNPYEYAKSTEYKNLLNYCIKYGKASLPLVIDKLDHENTFIINLLKDLTYDGKQSFIDDIKPDVPLEMGKDLPSIYSNLVDYCKELLAKEEVNILNSIKKLSSVEEESFQVNISVNNQDILINLYSVKKEKASLAIYNVSGVVEYKEKHNISKGNQTIVINVSNLKKGIYVVQITVRGESISQTISI